jgi:TolB-like protein
MTTNTTTKLAALFSAALLASAPLRAMGEDMDTAIAKLAAELGASIAAKSDGKVAAVDFVDVQGRQIELGRILAENLSVELVNQPKISVVDRANIKSILDEHKLTEEGLVKKENAKKLGEFAGVSVLITGTVASMDNEISVTVKAIAAETSDIIAAKKTRFEKTKDIQQFLSRRVGEGSSGPGPSTPGAETKLADGTIVRIEGETIASKVLADKNLGADLLFELKSARRSTGTGAAILLAFDIHNRDIQKAVELRVPLTRTRNLDSRLTDSTGGVWSLEKGLGLQIGKGNEYWYVIIQPDEVAQLSFSFDSYSGYAGKNNDFRLDFEMWLYVEESGILKNFTLDNIKLPE